MKISHINSLNPNFGKISLKKKTQEKIGPQNPNLDLKDFEDAILSDEIRSKRTLFDYSVLRKVKSSFTNDAQKIYDSALEMARVSQSKEAEEWHFYLASLLVLRGYLNKVIEGKIDPLEETSYNTIHVFSNSIAPDCQIWDDSRMLEDARAIVDKHIAKLMDTKVRNSKKAHRERFLTPPLPSAQVISALSELYNDYCKKSDDEAPEFLDDFWLEFPFYSTDEELKEDAREFFLELKTLGSTKKTDSKNSHSIEFYDQKAEAILKNIELGNNVLVLCNFENASSYEYLQDSFLNLLRRQEKNSSFGPDKTEVILLNDNATFDFIDSKTRSIKFNSEKRGTNTIFFGDLNKILQNAGTVAQTSYINMLYGTQSAKDGYGTKFVFCVAPEVYHQNTLSPLSPLTILLQSYAQQVLPVLNASDAKKYLTNQSGVEFVQAKTGKKVLLEAINRAIELTSSNGGNFPEKAVNLLDAAAKFYINEDEIKPFHLDDYIAQTSHLSAISDTKERSVIFDTGKTLDDIKGMPMTLAQAKSICSQIENQTLKTCGYIIMHNDQTAYGGGRRHCAEAIAGQTGIPMVVINAKDFALKDIDALSQEAGLSEVKIKKLIQTAKAQAEANRLNTAMVFIENFDNFGSNPLCGISSIYEQKAFGQLLSEMEAARKEDRINLIVIGSMNMPETLDENILKPYKFLNKIIVYQPQDKKQTQEILRYYIKKNNIEIAGQNQKEKDALIGKISQTAMGLTTVELMYLLDRAKIISQERGKQAIDSLDFTESYLQTISGQVNTAYFSDVDKRIVTSHEAGHALVLSVMNEIMKKQNAPWNISESVDFIALDPRGDFMGAVFSKMPENMIFSFERIMANIVCNYGGHSAEKNIYKINGSYGISSDMKTAQDVARCAVIEYGMGKRTGVRHIEADAYITEKQKQSVADDTEEILRAAREISDNIIRIYRQFILEFTEKYYSKVATGECIVSYDEFTEALNDWKSRQTPAKLKEIEKLESEITRKLQDAKSNHYQ